MKTICSVMGCTKFAIARGWCRNHYAVWWRNGDVNHKPHQRPKCKVDDCTNLSRAWGYCTHHYEKYRRFGNPTQETQYEHRNGLCNVKGCEKPKQARGLCQNHYAIFNSYRIDPSKVDVVQCYICGKIWDTWNTHDINVEHIIPRVQGGTIHIKNLGISCRTCNKKKYDMNYDELIEWCHLVISHHYEQRQRSEED